MVSKKHIAIAAVNIQTVWSKLNHKSDNAALVLGVDGSNSDSVKVESAVSEEIIQDVSSFQHNILLFLFSCLNTCRLPISQLMLKTMVKKVKISILLEFIFI